MDNKINNYLEYLNQLSYPEYADEANGNGSLQATLLDLSFDDGQKIDNMLFEIVQLGEAIASKYSPAQRQELLTLISEYLSVEKGNILITAGSDGALGVISRAIISTNTRVGIPLPSFGRFEYHTKVNRGDIFFLKPSEFPYDISYHSVIEFVQERSIDILFLANPNNPTGIYKPSDKLIELLENYDGYLVLDEALGDYIYEESAAKLVNQYPKLIITKSFSKLFGLAGMRIGYIVASEELIKPFSKLVSPFEVSSLALCLATEQLRNRETIIKERRRDLLTSLKHVWSFKHPLLKFSPTQSSTFTLKNYGENDLYGLLINSGVKSVPGKDFRGLENENCVRISLKNNREAKILIDKFKSIAMYL